MKMLFTFTFTFRAVSQFVVVSTLMLFVNMAMPAGYHDYLDDGHLLVDQLKKILIEEQVCNSIIDCQSHGGHTFIKAVKHGVEVSIYGIKRDQVAAKLLQTCAASFATKSLGKEMTVVIYNIGSEERLSQSAFTKAPPSYTLKLEKTNANR